MFGEVFQCQLPGALPYARIFDKKTRILMLLKAKPMWIDSDFVRFLNAPDSVADLH